MPPVSLRASTAEKVSVSTQRCGLDRGRLQRLAGLGGDRQRQVLDPLADQLGGAVEHRGALVLGEVGGLEGLVRRLGGAVDERRVAVRDPADDAAVVGALDLAPLAGLDPLAGREKLVIDAASIAMRLPFEQSRLEQAATRPARTCCPRDARSRLDRHSYSPSLLVLRAAGAGQAARQLGRHGHGFGHGVGMSAYGAYGYALHGKGYRFILGHYYTGTTIGTLAGPRVVRVLLDISGGDVGFSGATSACGQALDPARSYEAHRGRRRGRAAQLRRQAARQLRPQAARRRQRPDRRSPAIGTYRGALETVPTESDAGSLNVVNALAVDQYVKGVIPNESPPSWPVEELRAQAVASRSFALTAGVGGNGFDLYADTRSQVYEGLESEYATHQRAADATRGQVVEYGGKIAETLFSACSGGHTESIQNVFGGAAIPYLVGVPDPYDGYCPLHDWTLEFSGPEISAKLGAYLDGRLKQVVDHQARRLARGSSAPS